MKYSSYTSKNSTLITFIVVLEFKFNHLLKQIQTHIFYDLIHLHIISGSMFRINCKLKNDCISYYRLIFLLYELIQKIVHHLK